MQMQQFPSRLAFFYLPSSLLAQARSSIYRHRFSRIRHPMSRTYLFTSESVSEGHPDKIADQISDAVLDAIIAEDPKARVACETLIKTGVVVLAGEITTAAWVDFDQIVRDTVVGIGYDNSDVGFDGATLRGIVSAIGKQSPDIAQGVDRKRPGGAGRRRPGPDVRLRLQRNRRADARPHHLRPPAGAAAGRNAQERRAAVAAPRRQEPNHLRYDNNKIRASMPWCCPPSTRRHQLQDAVRSGDGRHHQARAARRSGWTSTPSTSSTRPAVSSSAARWATAV
jgi:hypothetical protein